MTTREEDRQLAEARRQYLADEIDLPRYEAYVDAICRGNEVFVLGMETERVWM